MPISDENVKIRYHADMNIIPQSQSGLYAFGTVSVGQLFTLKDVKVVFIRREEQEERLEVCLPRYFNKRKNVWEPVIFLTKEEKEELDKAVIEDIKQKMLLTSTPVEEQMDINVTVCSESFYPTLGYAELSYRNALTIKHIRISETDKGSILITFPSNQMKNGSYINLAGISTVEMQRGVEESIKEIFHKAYEEKYGKAYEVKQRAAGVPSEAPSGR